MNLFEVFPQLERMHVRALKDRALRLISLSGIVYDDEAFYFELGDERLWGRLPDGGVTIGIGAAKVQPDGTNPPHRSLVRYLRTQWRCDVNFFRAGYAYILNEDKQVVVLEQVDAVTPYFFILTAPQLGGGEMPDALAQAVYLLPVHRWRGTARRNLVKVYREALADFLAPRDWDLDALQTQPWVEIHAARTLPKNARLRPILALRGLQHLSQTGALPAHLHPLTVHEV